MAESSFKAQEVDKYLVQSILHAQGLVHLSVVRRGALLTVVSEDNFGKEPHFRLRRVTKQWWLLEAPQGTGFVSMEIRGNISHVLGEILKNYSWLLVQR